MSETDPNLKRWVAMQVKALRRANLRASLASEEWNSRNEAWKAKAKAEGWGYLDNARRKAENLPLKDAFSAATYWQQEAMRIASSIQAELAARQLMAIADKATEESA